MPAALLVTVLAYAYKRLGRLPAAVGALCGVKSVIIAIVVQALVALSRSAIKTRLLLVIGLFAGVANLLGVSPVGAS